MKKVYCEEYLRLSEEVLWKLEVIASSIEEESTKKQLIEGGVDLMFSNTLRFLYRSGEITDEGLETGLSYLEDYHAEKTRKDIEADLTQ
mgnify:CR=1 FL=1